MVEIVEFMTARRSLEGLFGCVIDEDELITADAVSACVPGMEWVPIPMWGRKPDLEVAAWAGLPGPSTRTALWMLTLPSMFNRRGWRFSSADLEAAFASHIAEMGERVFGDGGDVIVWSEAGRAIWLFHHEGVFSHVSLL